MEQFPQQPGRPDIDVPVGPRRRRIWPAFVGAGILSFALVVGATAFVVDKANHSLDHIAPEGATGYVPSPSASPDQVDEIVVPEPVETTTDPIDAALYDLRQGIYVGQFCEDQAEYVDDLGRSMTRRLWVSTVKGPQERGTVGWYWSTSAADNDVSVADLYDAAIANWC